MAMGYFWIGNLFWDTGGDRTVVSMPFTVVTKGSKYVCTGWLSDHVTTYTNDHTGVSDNFRKEARQSGRKMVLQFNENTGRIEMDDDMKKDKRNGDTFRGMYPKLSEIDTIVDETTQDRGI